MATYTAELGDTVVIMKAGGRCEVNVKTAEGWEGFRSDLHDADTAWEVARMKLVETKGQKVWCRLESEPESAIRPYQPS